MARRRWCAADRRTRHGLRIVLQTEERLALPKAGIEPPGRWGVDRLDPSQESRAASRSPRASRVLPRMNVASGMRGSPGKSATKRSRTSARQRIEAVRKGSLAHEPEPVGLVEADRWRRRQSQRQQDATGARTAARRFMRFILPWDAREPTAMLPSAHALCLRPRPHADSLAPRPGCHGPRHARPPGGPVAALCRLVPTATALVS